MLDGFKLIVFALNVFFKQGFQLAKHFLYRQIDRKPEKACYTGTMAFSPIVIQSIIEPFSTRTICFLQKNLVVNFSGVDAD